MIELEQYERDAWTPPPEETIVQWAERILVLPRKVSSISGPLSFDLTPYMRGPLLALTSPDVDELVICCATQMMKTTLLIVSALYYLANDPHGIFHVMPSEDEALEVKRERYEPIIYESPELRKLIDVDRKTGQFSGDTINLNGCVITFRGAHSASGLASKPAKIAFADEVDKWPSWAGDESDPVSLLEERLGTFHDAKCVFASTPTTRHQYIWRLLEGSTNERYFVPCPHCGVYQVLVFGDGTPGTPGLKWPRDERNPERVIAEKLAWYECASCHERVDETSKREMVEQGVWAPLGSRVVGGELVGPPPIQRRKGYQLWKAYSLFPRHTWSRIAAKWIESHKEPMLLMTFVTAWLAEPWEVHVNELKDFEVRARCTDYFVGQIPEGARAVTFGVDVQARGEQTYQYYVVRAWGADGQSWLVRYGVAQSWSVLNAVIFDADYGSVTKIRPLVDSGFRTGEVYEWCSAVGGIASKGDARNRQHVSHTTIAKGPDTPDVVEFVSFNPDYYKTWLHRLMRQPDRWHLPREVDDEYVEHMVAEQQQFVPDKRTGRQRVEWKLRSEGRANHYFDCEVLALVIADLSQIAHPAVVPAETPKAVSKPEEENRPSAMKPVAYWREKKKPAAGVVRMFS